MMSDGNSGNDGLIGDAGSDTKVNWTFWRMIHFRRHRIEQAGIVAGGNDVLSGVREQCDRLYGGFPAR